MRTEHSVKFVDMGACLDAPASAADRYEVLRDTGSFLLLDPATWDTVAAGMIRGAR